jgi:predicted GIY-YIG superfamily endonuclease
MDTIIFMIYKTYIYTLSDSFGNIRYVGKTDNPIKRLKTHIYESKKLKKTHKHNWILSLLNRWEFK